MLKKISNLTGAVALSKDDQAAVKGGLLRNCGPAGYCWSTIYGEGCRPFANGCELVCCDTLPDA